MKLPNGYGSIYRLPGNRRLPWTIRITLSCRKAENGKRLWKYQYLGYYATHEEALSHLVHLHDTTNSDIISYQPSFEQIFTLWSVETYPHISASNIRGYNAAFKSCSELHKLPFNSIDRALLQATLDRCQKNYPMLRKLKILFSSLYKYAIQNDICKRDYSSHLNIRQYKDRNPNHTNRMPFTEDEMNELWKHSFEREYQIVLILLYTGCRISELLQLKKEHIDLNNRFFTITRSKTNAGIRSIPIADKIYPLFAALYEQSKSDYLISDKNHEYYTYQHYYKYHWKPLFFKNKMDIHKPHDTRHTFVTRLTIAGINDKIIKRLIGHAGVGVTEKVYTHFDLKQLSLAVNQI